MINIKRASTTHTILMYLKMKNHRFSTKQIIHNFNPIKFGSSYDVQDSLNFLVDQGFAISKNQEYTITPQGKEALCFITAQQPLPRYNDKASVI